MIHALAARQILARARCAVCVLLLCLLAIPPTPVHSLDEPDVFTQLLPNGMLAVVRERPSSRLAAITVGIRGGSRVEDTTTLGAAHFMEHMYFQGTVRRPNLGDVDRDIEALGGFNNAWTGQESINFQIVVPSHGFDVGLDIMADMMVNSTFPEDRFEKERRVVLEELNQAYNNPRSYLSEIFYTEIFKGHPTEKLPIGSRETINRISRDVIITYRDTFFVASNMVVSVVGNVRHDDVFPRLADAFAGMRRGPRPEFQPAPPPAATGRRVGVPYAAQQAQLTLGFPTPGLNSPDQYPLVVLNALLGDAGLRLETDIVDEQGLAAGVGSEYFPYTDVGVWLAAASTRPAQLDAVAARIGYHLRRMADEPVTAAELAEAKSFIAGRLELGQESAEAQAVELSDGLVLGIYMPIPEYLARIEQVAAEDIQRVARQYLDPDRALLVVLPGAP